ncbi:MAG: NADH:ubiquinone reductase (Na(+)-transporting) subunit C [Rhodobacter sp.]|nr:NADH:ubiquinone reductase (Na(+)-transporting) subunit C [Rhodobacter sp.]
MPGLNPVALWRQLLALPNESRGKTLAMAFLVAAVCSLMVSMAAVVLQPQIDANKAAERQAKLDAMIAELPELAGVLAGAGADTLQTVIVDLKTGTETGELFDGFDMAEVAADPETSTELSDDQDIAGIGRRPDYAEIHVLKAGGKLELVILPVYAAGYQSTIRAFLALRGDLNTVAGLVVTEQGETPGLGANVATPAWQALWPGKKLADENGVLRLTVVRGRGTTEFEVDGITGATRTSTAVSDMIAFWTGPNGYAKLLDALRAGEL